ncbi:hypothetical protein CY35_18G039700 [Sphagnum magellanicum]|nr:hypothetical protein CY35_18G039700 [Sphagnum magellanicum]
MEALELDNSQTALFGPANTCPPFGSSHAVTSGLLAVLTVNLILAGYIFLALRAKAAPNSSLDPPFLLLSRPAEVSSIIKPPGNSAKAPIESFSTNLPEP